ncbi:hypothetical protein M8037_22165 [Sinorhizobium meliloti]|uniref:hypothetical protein n=1 Tax=Rhizobium meliloti TaxID=382 RepID=UPI00207409E6|nr:hypothetical protein [Sinorhizobium meliloti]MCM5691433.1 hypothetical protein [Sinorhizobium meliloti]
MQSSAVEITKFRTTSVQREKSEIIATCKVHIGDFTLHNVALRRPHDGGHDFVALPGKGACGISITADSDTRQAIVEAVYARYRLEKEIDRWN